MSCASSGRRLAVVDGHVHVHARVDPAQMLEHAWRNLLAAHTGACADCIPVPYLLLAEYGNASFFERLTLEGRIAAGLWQVRPTREPTSVIVSDGSRAIVIVAGRQVVTAEGLEVLLLGTRERFPDGLPARDLLSATASQGVLRVLPWGVGKWWFGRGRLVRALVQEFRGPDLFVGDSGVRPWFWARPALLREAERLGTRLLSGTDPLPFAHEAMRAGTTGFTVELASWDEGHPAGALLATLANPAARPLAFRRPERAARFVFNQVGMQLRRRSQESEK